MSAVLKKILKSFFGTLSVLSITTDIPFSVAVDTVPYGALKYTSLLDVVTSALNEKM